MSKPTQIIDQEPTLRDVITAVNSSFTAVTLEIHDIKADIKGIKQEISSIKGKMVTKDYLDDKLADLKADIVGLVRKEDHKVNTVVSILQDHQVLSDQDVQQINQVGLLPKTTPTTSAVYS